MAKKQYDLAVFIGRFQIFHNGHLSVIKEGLQQAEHVLIIIGSSHEPRSYRNPFTYPEREQMILDACEEFNDHITVEPIQDTIYNDSQWIERVQEIVGEASNWITSYTFKEEVQVALIGHEKDHSSYYLKLFPQWSNIAAHNIDEISSTDIRKSYFDPSSAQIPDLLFGEGRLLPITTVKFLQHFRETDDYREVVEEYQFIEKYKQSWAGAPYSPTFVTSDACVIQSGHILLVKRKARPGKGQWALPGGFVEANERIEDGMIRELREETRIKVPAPVLRGNIKSRQVFDNPHRSARGRTITHGFLISLPPDVNLPAVKGGDDAETARWWPISEVTRNIMFEDHYDIIHYFYSML